VFHETALRKKAWWCKMVGTPLDHYKIVQFSWKRKRQSSKVWWQTPIILALRGMRQFGASLGYVSNNQKQTNQNQTTTTKTRQKEKGECLGKEKELRK
jgi:hypothetical protein